MQSLKLTDRWRPRAFPEVVGQKRVIDWCRAKVQTTAESALFHGPSGCGKNTFARLYARGLACEAPADGGLPCGCCKACLASTLEGSRSDFYAEINCAAVDSRQIGYELELLRIAPLTGKRRVLVLDEAHNLSKKQQDMTLRALERPAAPFTVVLLTTEIDKIRAAVLGRLASHYLPPPSIEEVVAHGRHVCAAEKIAYEDDALRILAEASGGKIRDFLQSLDDAKCSGNTITAASARAMSDLESGRCIDFLGDLLRGNLRDAESKVPSRPSDVQTMAHLAGRIFLGLEYRARQVKSGDELFSGTLESKLAKLSELVETAAAKTGLGGRRLRTELIRMFNRKPRDAHHLRSIVLQAHDALHESAHLASGGRGRASPNAARSRPHILARADLGRHMTLDQAKRIWDASSLMAQVHGKYFNARIAIRLEHCDLDGLRASRAFLGRLIKNLTDRVQDWCGEELHWAYAQSDDRGRPLIVVALAVPNSVLSQCAAWLDKSTQGDAAIQVVFRCCATTTLTGRASYHRRLLRLLCRSVDPGVGVRRRPPMALVDAIGVPARLRPREPQFSPIPPRVSKTIGSLVWHDWRRAGLPVLTPASDGAWDYDFLGWELHEHGDRRREIHRQQAGVEQFSVTSDIEPNGGISFADPRQRHRSWTAKKPAWWQKG